MGEKELAAQLAAALAAKDEALALAVETSIQRDKALGLLETAAAAATTKPPAPKPAAPAPPAPPPPPALPPPPRPKGPLDYYALSSAERARVREFHGADIEDVLDAEFNAELRLENNRARGAGSSTHRIATLGDAPLGGGHLPEAPYRASDYDPPAVSAQKWRDRTNEQLAAGRALLASLPPGHPLAAAVASANAPGNPGPPRRSAPPAPPAPEPAPARSGRSIRIR